MLPANRDLIKNLPVPPGQKRRFDCPECGGKRTLSVSNELGTKVYNCYKASCAIHGAISSSGATVDNLLSLLHPKPSSYSFTIPGHLTDINGNQYASGWLKRYPSGVLAIERGLVDVYFDPKENRVCFAYSALGLVGLCGRSLTSGVKPKWRRYDKHPIPCIYGHGRSTVVLVEDAVSAAAVAATEDFAGVALLGTSLSSGFTAWAKFDKMIVALDKDASAKALAMQRKLSWFKPTSVCLLDKDLKCYSVDDIRKQLNETTSNL